MKILSVIPYFSPVYGGPPQMVRQLSRAEAALGATVDVVTTDADGDRTLDVPLQTWQSAEGYRVQYFPRQWLRQYTISRPLSQWLHTHVSAYDVVHLHNVFTYPGWATDRACQRHRTPLIRTPHGMLAPYAMAHKLLKKRLFLDLVERPIFARTRLVQALTQQEALELRDLGITAPIQVIPNGIDPYILRSPPDREPFWQAFPSLRKQRLILFLARLDPLKGLDLLAEAFGTIHQDCPDAHLVIAGADLVNYRPRIEAILQAAGCHHAATFTGLLQGELKRSALAAAEVFVSPSRTEGFSLSVVEALGAGLPAVITTGCHFQEAATANVALEVPIQAEAIAQGILQCLHHPDWAKEMGDRASHFIRQRYTWDTIAKQLLIQCDRLHQNAIRLSNPSFGY